MERSLERSNERSDSGGSPCVCACPRKTYRAATHTRTYRATAEFSRNFRPQKQKEKTRQVRRYALGKGQIESAFSACTGPDAAKLRGKPLHNNQTPPGCWRQHHRLSVLHRRHCRPLASLLLANLAACKADRSDPATTRRQGKGRSCLPRDSPSQPHHEKTHKISKSRQLSLPRGAVSSPNYASSCSLDHPDPVSPKTRQHPPPPQLTSILR